MSDDCNLVDGIPDGHGVSPFKRIDVLGLVTAICGFKPDEFPKDKVCSFCANCLQYVENAEFGCTTCGSRAIEIMSQAAGATSSMALVAAQESAEAVVIMARYLNSLETGDDNHPLTEIRRTYQAPMRNALNKALNKMLTQKEVSSGS
jgi:hypothetical protein